MTWQGRKRIVDRQWKIIAMTEGLPRWVTGGLGAWIVIRPWLDMHRSILW